MPIPKIDPKKIFASQAPSQDVPAEFNNYERGWDESRKNNGKPTIKQFNKLQQLTDEKILWMHQNGAALPFDETMEYAEGAVVVKDGELKQKEGLNWIPIFKKEIDASDVFDEIGKNQQELNDLQALKNRDLTSIFDFDRTIEAVAGVDSALKINAVIQETELTNTNPYLFFPATGRNYQLNAPLVFRKPVPKILGQLPANYDRYPIDGWFLVNNTECGFDLGASESTHTGGSWTLENIGFKPATTDLNYVADGIRVTSARNAPERGYTITEVSAAKMNYGIYIKNSANFMACTMDIKNCNLSQCNYGFYADQKVDGFKFTGNQCEQNAIGGIKLKGAGGINISDNMLEGQPNTIEIDGWSVQSGSQVEIKRNYFEGNYGDFLISYKDTSYGKGVLEISNNQIADLGVHRQQPVDKVIDFCRIYNNVYGYGYTVINKEPYPITMMDDVTILPESTLSGKKFNYFIQKGFNGNLGSKVFTSNPISAQSDPTYTAMETRGDSVERLISTPFGTARAPLSSDYLRAVVNAVAGDVVSVNILFKASFSDSLESGISLVAYTPETTTILQMDSAQVTQDLNGRYILGTFTFKMPSDQDRILLRVRNSFEPDAVQMIAGCFKNHGQFTTPLKIKQVMPSVERMLSVVHQVPADTIPAGGSKSYAIPLTGARLGDFVDVGYTSRLVGLTKTVEVSSDNTLALTLRNSTAADIETTSFRCFIKVSKG